MRRLDRRSRALELARGVGVPPPGGGRWTRTGDDETIDVLRRRRCLVKTWAAVALGVMNVVLLAIVVAMAVEPSVASPVAAGLNIALETDVDDLEDRALELDIYC